ncbi:MAG: DUF4416 family protein [Candidatus Magnetomorum sp.]|nr:DUF4416 family protein [Candidatus Magnetomorum sp.]
MSAPQPPKPACLIVGMFMKDQSLFEGAVNQLILSFGPVEMVSRWFDFDYTSYYEKEMGTPLFRRMVSFKKAIDPATLPEIKQTTNTIEKQFGDQDRRQINIDPGYIVPERFVLATGKNFTHRIYLNKGIYADLTLIYQKGKFQDLPWTYPDYAAENVKSFLTTVRMHYLASMME